MRTIQLTPPRKNAKTFLIGLVPDLLSALGIARQQKILGFTINIESEAKRRINDLTESQAKKALDTLKELMKEW